MKTRTGVTLAALLAVAAVSGTAPARAADDVYQVQIEEALASPDAKKVLDGSVDFYFGDTKHSKVAQDFGNFVTNKKTNGFGKSAATACNWMFLSALLQLQQRATELGGNAVVNIHSFYKRNEVSSNTQVECHKGFTVAGIALKGDVVKLTGK